MHLTTRYDRSYTIFYQLCTIVTTEMRCITDEISFSRVCRVFSAIPYTLAELYNASNNYIRKQGGRHVDPFERKHSHLWNATRCDIKRIANAKVIVMFACFVFRGGVLPRKEIKARSEMIKTQLQILCSP